MRHPLAYFFEIRDHFRRRCGEAWSGLEETNPTEVAYRMSRAYSPEHGCGVRWNDPAFGIDWPEGRPILDRRDATYPDF